MLTIKKLSKSFDAHQVLNQLDLTIISGGLTAIIGPNGCGKSTLFNLITGELVADSGDIFFNEKCINGLKPKNVAQVGIVRKFQTPGIYPHMTVFEHLQLPFVIQKKKIQLTDIQQIAERVGLINHFSVCAGILSTGQKQWLEMAVLILLKPTLLLLDEPIAGMTATESEKTREILQQLNSDGLTIVTIEHNIGFVRALTDDIVVIMNGQVVMRSDYAEISDNEQIKKDYLGSLYV